MRLERLSVRGFRCFSDLADVPFHRLSIFIGENDSGKTALLDALELLLTSETPKPSDFHRAADGTPGGPIEIVGLFVLEAHDTVPQEWRGPDNRFRVKKTFTPESRECHVDGLVFLEPRWATFSKLSAEEQRELLVGRGFAPGANKTERQLQCEQAISQGQVPRVPGLVAVDMAALRDHLPRFDRVASAEYNHPDSIIQRTLRRVVEGVVEPVDAATGQRVLRLELGKLRDELKGELDKKVAEMMAHVTAVHPKVKSMSVAPQLEFSRSVSTMNLMLDTGDGPRAVDACGEGTKKKLWVALLEWERDTIKGIPQQAVFRVLDEPDVNLDYAAERRIFSNLLADVDEQGSRLQAVVCTHAMTLVDRAPAESINLIRVAPDGLRRVEYLEGSQDAEVREFLGSVGRTIGVSNSALFYERAFIVVEGESEENAIPVLYRAIHGRSMAADGIVLLNLATCSAWKAALGILLKNRSTVTVMLLDSDCRNPESSGYVTSASLATVGYPPEFLEQSCFFVGTREFEDAFDDADIVAVLNDEWPRDDTPWTSLDLAELRNTAVKFSDELLKRVRTSCRPEKRQSARKPGFALRLARQAATTARIPTAICEALQALRDRANGS